jgi:transcription elongation GreA/GreB family factor
MTGFGRGRLRFGLWRSGGLEVEYKGSEIMVITPHSPLGQQLMGKKAGQRWTTSFNGSRMNYRIVSVT